MRTLLLGLFLAFAGAQAQGATVTVVHPFAPLVTASQNPGSVIRGTDGNFYGVSSAGGTNGTGTVFKLSPTGNLTTLHNFTAADYYGDNSDGTSPGVRLVQGSDGNFYGTAIQGGANNTGTVFKVTPAGVFTTLASFAQVTPNNTNSGGAYPRAGLIQGPDGNFYGTASSGGANGKGVVFKVTPDGTLTALHDFSALNGANQNTDGAAPYAELVQGTDGSFYGLTSAGGANSQGVAFNITTAGTFTALYSFSALTNTSNGSVNAEGAKPLAALVQGSDGNFYGLANSGGAYAHGTFFQFTPQGAVKALHSFAGNEGSGFTAALVQVGNGNFFGVSQAAGAYGVGVIFQLTAQGTYAPSHAFDKADGQQPASALIQDTAGNLYGVAGLGGAYNGGTFFELASNGSFSALANFGLVSNADGAHSDAPLIMGKDGNFYGTTNSGGANGNGTIFRMTPAGAVTVLHTFSAEAEDFTNGDGAFPNGGLVQGSDGNFYGVASGGGDGGAGTVFQMRPAGSFTTLSAFAPVESDSSNETGAYPYAALFQGQDGNFYGTATAGGAYGNGTIFSVTPAGLMTTLYAFSAVDEGSGTNGDGAFPRAGLVQGADGNFYGVARYGGANDTGTIFKVTPTGSFTTLDNFDALDDGNYNQNGAYPGNALIRGKDGNFYGVSSYGGTNAGGTAFVVTPTGTLTTLHAFATPDPNTHVNDGVEPEASLVQGTNGLFYGTTSRGSVKNVGTVFQLTSTGAFTTLCNFGSGGSGAGAKPFAGLVQGRTPGAFFGTTTIGGNGAGTIFRVNLLNPTATLATQASP